MNVAMQADFNRWWADYPRKVGRLAAMREYERARKIATAEELLGGIGNYLLHKPSYADYAHPKTWLSQGRWLDDYEAATTPIAPVQSVDDFLASMGHWTAGCKRLHGGTCGSANEHYAKVDASAPPQERV